MLKRGLDNGVNRAFLGGRDPSDEENKEKLDEIIEKWGNVSPLPTQGWEPGYAPGSWRMETASNGGLTELKKDEKGVEGQLIPVPVFKWIPGLIYLLTFSIEPCWSTGTQNNVTLSASIRCIYMILFRWHSRCTCSDIKKVVKISV